MKRITLLTFVILCFLTSIAFASDAQRKISTGRKTANEVIKTTSGVIYDIEIVATAANGYAVVFDSASTNPGVAGDKQLVEVSEATQYNGQHVNLGTEGIKAYKGLSLYLKDASAIIYYY